MHKIRPKLIGYISLHLCNLCLKFHLGLQQTFVIGCYFIICPITIAYSMGQIIKPVCVCQCVSVCVHLWALSRSHFLIDFYQNWHRRKNPQKCMCVTNFW